MIRRTSYHVDLSQLISLTKTSFLSAQYEKDFFKRNINYALPIHFQVLHDSMQKPFFMSIQSRKGISTYVYQCNYVLRYYVVLDAFILYETVYFFQFQIFIYSYFSQVLSIHSVFCFLLFPLLISK